MVGSCGTFGGGESYVQGFGKETALLGDSGVEGSLILRWIFRKWDVGVMEWIELAQDRDR
jgi:hypothetical protein